MFHLINKERNWFPVIVAGLTILLACLFYVTNHSVDFSSARLWFHNDATEEFSPVTEADYQSAVMTIMAQYQAEKNAQAAYDAFILLHVPGSMQSFHIDLIVAFGKLTSGDDVEGQTRLDTLSLQYSWFIM